MFEETRTYRYRLTRVWNDTGPTVVWIMLNPSTADENSDDPTIRRVVGFSRRWGFGSCLVVNLFAKRTPRPGDLRHSEDPVGPDNDRVLGEALASTATVIAAWGNHGRIPNPATGELRCEEMWRMLETARRDVSCLGLTSLGQPTHPLYRPGDTAPVVASLA